MATDTQRLAARLATTLTSAASGVTPAWLWRPLLQHLANGDPVVVEDLAAMTGTTTEQVRDALAGMPDTEYDEQGHIIGAGLTLRPTPHRFEVNGHQLYTWCALDTLTFPAVLDRPAHVTSPCQGTGAPIRLIVHPDRVTDVDPAAAVVSLVAPQECSSIRSAFCNQVHFFASPAAAQPWLDEHPGASVLPVADAFDIGHRLADTLNGDDPGCC